MPSATILNITPFEVRAFWTVWRAHAQAALEAAERKDALAARIHQMRANTARLNLRRAALVTMPNVARAAQTAGAV